LQVAVDAAFRDLNPNGRSCIIKLYFDAPKYAERGKRRFFFWTIAGKKYLIELFYFDFRDTLPLEESYEHFLSKLGKHSRRNMRNVRRQAVRSGVTHQMERALPCPSPELLVLGDHAYPAASKAETIAKSDRLIGKLGQGFHSILRLQSGEIISCCSGLIERDTAFILYQLNHRDYLKHNPCLTNRAFLIESLIQAGIKNVVFAGGCTGVLNHACLRGSGAILWFIRPTFRSLLFLAEFTASEIPRKLARFIVRLLRSLKTNSA
jgi:hypothetical protein